MRDSVCRVAVITGGTRGIGRATALSLSERGYKLALSYQSDDEHAETTCREIRAQGATVISVKGDVSDEGHVHQLFDRATQELGDITAVVNNAGIVAASCSLADVSAERLQRMFQVNILGAFLVAREAARRLPLSRGGSGGSIVNISSVAARLGSPNEYIDYASSKAAVDTLTLGLAKELAHDGVRVNAVRPGLMDTDLHASGGQPDRAQRLGKSTPLGRPGTAQEAANAIIWLISEEASYVTGTLLDVAGGR